MRRTYDVLNILQAAEVVQVSRDKNKSYYYDPFVLEGSEAAQHHNNEAQISGEERLAREKQKSIEHKLKLAKKLSEHICIFNRLIKRNKKLFSR